MSVSEPGQLVDQRYQLTSLYPDQLPYSGVSVWNAVDTLLGISLRIIAVDRAHPHGTEALDAARRSSLIDDPRVVRILSAGEDDAVSYIATELPLGTPLSHYLHGEPFPADQVQALTGEISSALNEARIRGVRHLQLSPQQVRIGSQGEVFIDGLAVDAALAGLYSDSMIGSDADRIDARGLTVLMARMATGDGASDDDAVLRAAAATPDENIATLARRESDNDGALSPSDMVRAIAPWGAITPAVLPAAIEGGVPAPAKTSTPEPDASLDPLDDRIFGPSGMKPQWSSLDEFAQQHPEAIDPAATAIFSAAELEGEAEPAEELMTDDDALDATEDAAEAIDAEDMADAENLESDITDAVDATDADVLDAAEEPEAGADEESDDSMDSESTDAEPTSETETEVAADEASEESEADSPAVADSDLVSIADGPLTPSEAPTVVVDDSDAPPSVPVAGAAAAGAAALGAAGAGAAAANAVPPVRPSSFRPEPGNAPRPAPAGEVVAPRTYDPSKVVVIGAIVLVLIFGLWAMKTFFSPTSVPKPSASASISQNPEQPAAPVDGGIDLLPAPVAVDAVLLNPYGAQFDPSSINEQENPAMIPNLIDGNLGTQWKSWWYQYPNFNGQKEGIGIAIKLEEKSKVTSVTINSELAGGKVQWRNSSESAPNTGDVLAEVELVAGDNVLTAPTAQGMDTVILWIPEMSFEQNGRYRVTFNEASVQ